MKYFTLLCRFPNEKWEICFGDYDQDTVLDEQREYRDSSEYGQFMIIKTGESQACIDKAVNSLNELY